jgi:hypothetical protein
MQPDRAARVTELAEAALEYESSQRASFLDDAYATIGNAGRGRVTPRLADDLIQIYEKAG